MIEPPSAPPEKTTQATQFRKFTSVSLAEVLSWLKDYGFVITTLSAFIVGAVASFLTTRAHLNNQIDDLRTRIVRSESLRDEVTMRTLYLQQSNLRILEDEVLRIQTFVNQWRVPEFNWQNGPGNQSGGFPKTGESLVSFDLGLFWSLAVAAETRALKDTELTASLSQILGSLVEFNQEFQAVGFQGLGPAPPQMAFTKTAIRYPISRSEHDKFEARTSPCINRLKGLLPGILPRLQNARTELAKTVQTYESRRK